MNCILDDPNKIFFQIFTVEGTSCSLIMFILKTQYLNKSNVYRYPQITEDYHLVPIGLSNTVLKHTSRKDFF